MRMNPFRRFDDSDDVRSMVQLQKEVRAIQDASTGAATDVVRYYGLTFHEVAERNFLADLEITPE
jgi:hypothetical protein